MKFKNCPQTIIGKKISEGLFRYYENHIQKINKPWNELSYSQKHYRVRKLLPKPALCICGKNIPTGVHNISGEYHEDIKDWKWLCHTCHMVTHSPWSNRPTNGLYEII